MAYQSILSKPIPFFVIYLCKKECCFLHLSFWVLDYPSNKLLRATLFHNLALQRSVFFQGLKLILQLRTQVWIFAFLLLIPTLLLKYEYCPFLLFSQHKICRMQGLWLFARLCIVAFLTTHGDLYGTSIFWKLCP